MPISDERRTAIKRLAYEGGEELSHAIALGEKEYEAHIKKIHAEITEFLTNSQDKDELDFFTENWTRDGREWPIHLLVQNPFVDAGTLLRTYWYSDPEFYFEGATKASDFDDDKTNRDIFLTLEAIEKRFANGSLKTASIPFDPEDFVTMREKHSTFARPIPAIMLEPIGG